MARILQLIASNARRGAETFASDLAGELTDRGHAVRVMAVARTDDADGLPAEVAGRSRRDVRGLTRIGMAARWSDVVIGSGSTTLLVGAGAALAGRRPFVYRSIGDPSIWGQVPHADLRIGRPARTAAKVVTLFPGAAATFRDRYGVPADRVVVIPNGVPADTFAPCDDSERAAARMRLGLDPDRRWVALVGALSPEKDPLLALRALAHLDAAVGLVVAGDGPLGREVRAASEGFGDRVRLLGITSDVAAVYAAADALVLPSRTEGVPAVAIEAALCELPVVATDVGGVSTVVVDRVTGRLLDRPTSEDVAGALAEALVHGVDWGAEGRRRCLATSTIEVVADAWSALVDTVIDGTIRP